MSSILGKVQGALVANENTLQLASINFDFSLFQVKAPPEFEGLGKVLSAQRREDAEQGTSHKTARRLGALFQQILPTTPELVRAYGQRSSEISQMPDINPQGSRSHGIFKEQAGADGTSIWAAATSGASAIAVHLLACMLARIWTPERATSVWTEIVERRKSIIKTTDHGLETQNWSTLMASQQTISRKEIAQWDASARAWLRRADEAMKIQQTRLMLIIKNVNIPVNNVGDTYDSVIQAWRISMITMEKLLKGMPQLVQNGAILLGLSSWHLYPDLNVLQEGAKLVSLEDNLIAKSAIVTIGLEDTSSDPESGVRWSLPLAYLRYYGEPIESSGALSQATERVSLSEFVQVVLGCVLAKWGFENSAKAAPVLQALAQIWRFLLRMVSELEAEHSKTSAELDTCQKDFAEWSSRLQELEQLEALENKPQNHDTPSNAFKSLADSMEIISKPKEEAWEKVVELKALLGTRKKESEEISQTLSRLRNVIYGSPSWPRLIFSAAQVYSASKGIFRKQYEMLQRLGMRTPSFLGQGNTEPIFGLTDPATLSSLFKDQERRIKLLRDLTSCLGIRKGLVIKFKLNIRPSETAPRETVFVTCGLTTAMERGGHGNAVEGAQHRRWMASEREEGKVDKMDISKAQTEWAKRSLPTGDKYCSEVQFINTSIDLFRNPSMQHIWTRKGDTLHQRDRDYGDFIWFKAPAPYDGPPPAELGNIQDDAYDVEMLDLPDGSYGSEDLGVMGCEDYILGTNEQRHRLDRAQHTTNMRRTTFRHLYGNPKEAALYCSGDAALPETARQFLKAAWITGIEAAFESNDIILAKFLDLIENMDVPINSEYNQSLQGPCIAAEIYESVPGATLSLEVIDEPLWKAKWIPKRDKSQINDKVLVWAKWRAPKIQRADAFSCIAFFESGSYNIDPEGLTSVMAVSSGDSIYVTAALINDPHEASGSTEIRRIIGNAGNPGIAMLVPPANPRIRKSVRAKYWLVKHDEFDGNLTDEFSKTQMDLSFTGWEQSINIGSSGSCDVAAYFLETLVRVVDAGEWVADLDILTALGSDLMHRCKCSCGFDGTKSPKVQSNLSSDISGTNNSTEQLNDRNATPATPVPFKLVSMDTWEELLQRPEDRAVVRAHGNWIARLAATSLSIGCKFHTYVLPDKATKICWSCLSRMPAIQEYGVLIL